MVRVGVAAPRFDCSAVVEGRLARLDWGRLHDNKTLVLLFVPDCGTAPLAEYLIAVGNAVARRVIPIARVAMVIRKDPDDALGWVNLPRAAGGPGALAFPLIVDPVGRVAEVYDLLGDGRTPLWGEVVIDPAGIIRQTAGGGFPSYPGVEELLRSIQAIGTPAAAEL
jgi:peroxiredoxin (alkyl hydroperoxide reductase subunit C)